ncbi:MAG: hypothetical protein WC802_00585 [Patescibacteria group bacterium]
MQWSMDVLTGHQQARLQKELSAVCTTAGFPCKPDDIVIKYRPKHERSNGAPVRVRITWSERGQERMGVSLEGLIRDCVVRFIPRPVPEVLTEYPASPAQPSELRNIRARKKLSQLLAATCHALRNHFW